VLEDHTSPTLLHR